VPRGFLFFILSQILDPKMSFERRKKKKYERAEKFIEKIKVI